MKYKSLNKYTLGNKTVFVVENEVERNRDNNDLLNKKVMIDDKEYIIKGVESFAIPIIRKGDRIGLLVNAT